MVALWVNLDAWFVLGPALVTLFWLGERLGELKSKRDFTNTATSGTSLVAIKKPLVDEAFAKLGLLLANGRRGRAPKDHNAYQNGRSAAERVALNAGVHGRAMAEGRLR